MALPLLYQPNALSQFITFSSLIFVSFTDFIVPWGLYIILQQQEERVRRGSLPATRAETEPLLSTQSAATYATENLGAQPGVPVLEHSALPESWGLSTGCKLWTSAVLVTILGSGSVAATYLQISQVRLRIVFVFRSASFWKKYAFPKVVACRRRCRRFRGF